MSEHEEETNNNNKLLIEAITAKVERFMNDKINSFSEELIPELICDTN